MSVRGKLLNIGCGPQHVKREIAPVMVNCSDEWLVGMIQPLRLLDLCVRYTTI